MATVILKFSLPDEKYDMEIAIFAHSLVSGRNDFKQYLRSLTKHRELSEEQSRLSEEISERFFECFRESFDKID